jgi:hypothetical protein
MDSLVASFFALGALGAWGCSAREDSARSPLVESGVGLDGRSRLPDSSVAESSARVDAEAVTDALYDSGLDSVTLSDTGSDDSDSPCPVADACTIVTGNPSALALDSTNVYWIEDTDDQVLSAPLVGGSPTTLATMQHLLTAIAVNSTGVYWVTDQGAGLGNIVTAPIGGGTVSTLFSAEPIAVDSTSVYFSAGYALYSVPIDGGSLTTVATLPGCFAANATHVVWARPAVPDIVIWSR